LGNYKVFTGEFTTLEQIIAALEACVEDGMDVVNLSLGSEDYINSLLDPEALAIRNAVSAGVVVVAAGNEGPDAGTIGSPGVARKSLTVGASCKPSQLNNNSYCSSSTPYLAEFSSRGPAYIYNKPDVLAPGVGICAAQWDDAFMNGSGIQCVDDDHVAISGTSMATPHAAGTLALLLSIEQNAHLEEVLEATAQKLPAGQDAHLHGAGLVRADRAVASLLQPK